MFDHDALMKQHCNMIKQAQAIQHIKNDPTLSIIYQELVTMNQKITQLEARRPRIIRIKPIDLTDRISLHQTEQFLQKEIPIPQGLKVYSLLINLHYYNASCNNQTHGYLSVRMGQRNDETNTVQLRSTKFNWYANTVNQLEMVPWNCNLPNQLQIRLYDTYNTQGQGNTYGKNYYILKLVGYMAY